MDNQQPGEGGGNGEPKDNAAAEVRRRPTPARRRGRRALEDNAVTEVRRVTLRHAKIRFWLLLDYATLLVGVFAIYVLFLAIALALDIIIQFVLHDAVSQNHDLQRIFYYLQIGEGIATFVGFIIHASLSLRDQLMWTRRMAMEDG